MFFYLSGTKLEREKYAPTPRVPPPLLILKISESSNFFPEKIQDLSPRVFTSIFTLLFFNVETLKIMSSIVLASNLLEEVTRRSIGYPQQSI